MNHEQPYKKKAVYQITEEDGRTYWKKVGHGFVNRDGSIALKLDAIPLHGALQVRDAKEVVA